MKKTDNPEKKPSKVKELYDQMQAEKENENAPNQQDRSGKKNRGPNSGKFNSQPRTVAKKYWRQ